MSTGPEQRPGWFADADFELALVQLERERPHSLWQAVRARLRRRAAVRWSLRFLIVLCSLSFLAPLLPLPSPAAINLASSPLPPQLPWVAPGALDFEPQYWELNALDRRLVSLRTSLFGKWRSGPWLGTDALGRDVLARVIWGSRTSLLVALCAALTSLVIGASWGALAGLCGGRVDNLMMRLVDVLFAVPTIFLVIFLLSVLDAPGASGARLSREQIFFLVVGAVSWLSMARIVRGQVLELERSAFVEAARAAGASTLWILTRHILPNVLGLVVVNLTLTLPSMILYEAFLSFLGLGVEPPHVSWGLLAAEGAEAINPLESYAWLVAAPGCAMAATLLALSTLGDGLRDALSVTEPRER